MFWPSSADYNEAMQNLTTSLGDEELRAGSTEQDKFGMPMPYAGNFADVYRIDCRATGKSWAVKCFTREVSDLRDRYRAIGEHLERNRLSFMTPFHYLNEGIRIAGQWYPIVKMRWIEGEGLNQFVSRFADDPETLRQLASLWITLADRLESAELAHADLQHGNVLLVPVPETNQLRVKLIDYDGMFVPALVGSGSRERGHPAFQHPQRLSEGTYGPDVDRFSHLVIYTALSCLADDPSLWRKFDNGQNLLFRDSDFRQPAESALFQRLWETTVSQSRDLVARLISAVKSPLEAVPRLSDIVRNGVVLPRSNDEDRSAEAALSRPTLKVIAGGASPPSAEARPASPRDAPAAAKRPVPQPRRVRAFQEHRGYVSSVTFVPNGRYVVTGSYDGSAILMDAADGRKLCEYVGHEGAVSAVDVSPNGRYVLTASHDRTAALWDAAKGRNLASYVGHQGAVTAAAFSGDGGSVFTASQDTTIVQWETATAQRLQQFCGHSAGVTAIAVRRDGRFLFTGSRDRTAIFWDARTAHRLRVFSVADGFVTSTAFSPTAEIGYTGQTDGTVAIWDLSTGDRVGTLRGHGGAVTAIVVTADGERIATASNDKTAALWDATNFERLQVLTGHDDYVTAAAFSPDGRFLITGSEDKSAVLWDTGFKKSPLRVVSGN